jgi:flavin reductase (DIM6/NTAB) family NADH-FMN oxidoreductase RutF
VGIDRDSSNGSRISNVSMANKKQQTILFSIEIRSTSASFIEEASDFNVQ